MTGSDLNNQTTYYLYCEGTAEQRENTVTKWGKDNNGNNIPLETKPMPQQRGRGHMHIKLMKGDAMDPGLDPDAEDEDGSALVFDAISGAAVNGLLPNGDYDASIIRLGAENLTKPPRQNFFAPSKNSSDSYCDETGYTFKINLTPINNPAFKPQGKFPSRNALEIHPTYHKNTDGCTGLTGTHSEIVRFWNYYNKIKTRQPKIILRVEIDNNNNLGIQKYKE